MKISKLIILLFFILSSTFFTNFSKADSLHIGIENDVFLHDDSDFTHGTQILWKHSSPLWIFDEWGIDVIQNMYTPGDIEDPEIQYGDRPYCGLLMGSFLGENTIPSRYGNIKIEQELGLGITGKASLAEFNQKKVHSLIRSRTPRGWDNQIAEEPIIQYQGYFALNHKLIDYKYFTILDIWKSSIMLGTFKDQLSFGLDFNMGLNPEENCGKVYSFSASQLSKEKIKTRIYGIYGLEIKRVLHDTSLDGTLFRKSEYTIDSENFVAEAHVGFTTEIWKFGVNFLYIVRTKEYESQDVSPDYCRLSFNLNF